MLFKKITKNNFSIYLLGFLFLLFLISALLAPIILDKNKSNWDAKLDNEISKGRNVILNSINSKITSLLKNSHTLKKELLSSSNYSKFIALVSKEKYNSLHIEIYNSNWDLIAWNKDPLYINSKGTFPNQKDEEVIPFRVNAVTYFSVQSTLKIQEESLFAIVSLPLQKHINTPIGQLEESSFKDTLSAQLQTEVELAFGKYSIISKDGRKHSFELKNNLNNKIGVASFFKQSLLNYTNQLQKNINLFQSALLVLIYLVIILLFRNWFTNLTSKLVRFLIFAFYLLGLRILMFVLEIPSSYIYNVLTDSSNFSSRFAFGIVRSPLEFFITAVTLIAISFYALKLSINHFKHSLEKPITVTWKFVVMLCLVIPLILMLWRAFGAIISSVIFDSTIRYFKEFTLFPSSAVTLMCIDILLAGVIILVSSLVLLLLAISFKPTFLKQKKYIVLLLLLALFQLSGWLYDSFQDLPQGTPLIRFVFFLFFFSIFYFVAYHKIKEAVKIVLIFFASSIISVALLTYYNSELEKDSLRTTAFDLTRLNQEQVKFMVYQSLVQLQEDTDVIEALEFNNEFAATSFKIWLNSLFYKEGMNTSIRFYNANKEYLGGFSSLNQAEQLNDINITEDFANEVRVNSSSSIYGKDNFIIGTAPVIVQNQLNGYVLIKVQYNNERVNIYNLPPFLATSRAGVASALDIGDIKIYEFLDDELNAFYGGEPLTTEEKNKILDASKAGSLESWIELPINNLNHLVFITNVGSGNRKLAIAREDKNYSWSLSDFFKIFFVHTLLIFIASILWSVFKIREFKNIVNSFRTKLVFAFLLISLIPLLLIAGYIRNLTEYKNSDLLKSRLNEKANHVGSYLTKYYTNSSVSMDLLFQKVASDLQINYSVFSKGPLLYSSYNNYIDAGLLNGYLDSEAFNKIFLNQSEKCSLIKDVEGHRYNVVYHKYSIGEFEYVIEVNDMFNKIELPLSDLELDIFLFGVFSFAVVLIVVVSTLLSGQISLPIKKLTNATRAVASGDLSIEVSVNEKGEIKELAEGFNMMVKKINQSQADIAQFEREDAWKEMAKQVAHEIKNPLTPMKLSVQQLIIAFNDKSPKFNDIFVKVTATVISQIEILKNIASEFSNFARMPRINVQRINLVSSITEALNLYNEEKRKVVFENTEEELFVKADSDQLKRTIVNIIRNSLQAEANLITVSLCKDEDKCLLRIEDNGKGIQSDNIQKVFEQSFTTKQGGMGIGLYMAKKFIESIDGEIVVENSLPGKTVFLITLPLA